MDTTIIRQRLHNYLETAEDKKVRAIYIMIENEIAEARVAYDDVFKAELDQRCENYKKDSSTAVSASESKRRIEGILKAACKK